MIIQRFAHRNVHHTRFVIVFILSVGLLLCIIYWCNRISFKSIESEKESLQFNANRWKNGDAKIRGGMVNDLCERKEVILIGKNKFDILELLGIPDFKTDDEWAYKVDVGELFFGSPWMYNFKIIFNRNGIAKEVMLLD